MEIMILMKNPNPAESLCAESLCAETLCAETLCAETLWAGPLSMEISRTQCMETTCIDYVMYSCTGNWLLAGRDVVGAQPRVGTG